MHFVPVLAQASRFTMKAISSGGSPPSAGLGAATTLQWGDEEGSTTQNGRFKGKHFPIQSMLWTE